MRNGGTRCRRSATIVPDSPEVHPALTPRRGRRSGPRGCGGGWWVTPGTGMPRPGRSVAPSPANDPSTRSHRGPDRVSGNSATSTNAAASTRWMTSWAIRSPRRTSIGHLGVGVDQQHGQLVPIARVDEAGSVEAGDPVSQRQTAPRLDEARVALREWPGSSRSAPGPDRPLASRVTSIRATRSAPASPGPRHSRAAGRSGSSRTTGTDARELARRRLDQRPSPP